MTQLTDRRAETEKKRAEAERAAGEAILDGKKPDLSTLASFASELEALQAAEAEMARRQRAADEAAHEKQLSANRTKLAALINDQIRDTEEAEAHARGLAAAYSRKLERITAMSKLAREITGKSVPTCLSKPELEKRLACRLSAVVGGGLPVNYRHRLGAMLFHPGIYRADENWREVDAATFATHLNPILGEPDAKS